MLFVPNELLNNKKESKQRRKKKCKGLERCKKGRATDRQNLMLFVPNELLNNKKELQDKKKKKKLNIEQKLTKICKKQDYNKREKETSDLL